MRSRARPHRRSAPVDMARRCRSSHDHARPTQARAPACRRTGNDHRTASKQVGSIVAFGVIPAVAVVFMFVVALALELARRRLPATRSTPRQSSSSHGTNPFPGPDAALTTGANYVWPPFVGYVVAPLTLLPATAADFAAAILSLIAFVAALWVVGVRDWRVYGASFLWPPVLGEVRTAHLTLVLCLLLAVAVAHARAVPVRRPHARRRAGAQVLPLAARRLARRAATVARRSARGLLRRRHAPASAAVHLAARVRAAPAPARTDLRPGQLHAVRARSPSSARRIASRRRSRSRSASASS